jgi:putative ABC transport system permease protein
MTSSVSDLPMAVGLPSNQQTAFLFEVEPTDPLMLGSAGVLFAAIGLLACWMPTRRATEVDPLEALRYD